MVTKFITIIAHLSIPNPRLLKETIFLDVIKSTIIMKQFILKQSTPLSLLTFSDTHAQKLENVVHDYVVKAC